jgi:CheY-like chemotaxis protein
VPSEARILVIDDQPYSRRLAESLLGTCYRVIAVGSAEAAWERLEAEGPCDLVVLDLMLADADGLETLARLRERWPEQHVLVLSSVGDPRAAVAAMRAGASDYLLKPIDRDGLPRAVERILEEARARKPAPERPAAPTPLERALDLLALGDRAEIERALLEALCLQAGASDALLWSVDGPRWALAAVHGDLTDEGTAPQRPPLSVAAESQLRSGEPSIEAEEGGGSPRLYVPCTCEGELIAVARLTPSDAGVDADCVAACGRIGRLGALALGRVRFPAGSQGAFRDPRTGLPGRAFLEEIGRLELHKAQRFGRRISVVCVELSGLDAWQEQRAVPVVVSALQRALRSTDALAAEGTRRFWVLVSDADPLGGVVLKRRLGQRLRAAMLEAGVGGPLSLGAASYPNDGERLDALCARALERLRDDREGLAPALAIDEDTALATIGNRLLERAMWMPASFVGEAAELVIGDVGSRPRDRGVLFLAPGQDRRALLEPLGGLADAETATEVFVATDGETLPVGPSVTALGLPPDVSPETTWIVRFGEGTAYALVAGRPRSDGARPVFHTSDAGLVEHLAFRLRAEVGFGVRG